MKYLKFARAQISKCKGRLKAKKVLRMQQRGLQLAKER